MDNGVEAAENSRVAISECYNLEMVLETFAFTLKRLHSILSNSNENELLFICDNVQNM